MLKNETYFIDSCDDVELNIKRESKLEYRITYDDSKEMKAIVFIIGGYGVNSNIAFLDFDRKFLCEKFDVVVVDVFYHCFCARKSINDEYNPKMVPNEDDINIMRDTLIKLGVNVFVNQNNFFDFIPLINTKIQEFKDKNLIDINLKAQLFCDFIPPNNEYQNYGIMAAIDHINALKDIIKNYPQFKSLPKIYGGGSYGGYLALMCAKIAPWYVDGVIDNSGVALPNLSHVLGREITTGEFAFNESNVMIMCYVKKFWTRNENSKYYFSDDNYLIRAILNSKHLYEQSKFNKDIIYIAYHSAKDQGAPVEDKIKLFETYKNLGFDVTLHLIEDETQIDGKFIKSLDHGLRMSNKALFNKELPKMLEKLKDKKFNPKEDEVSYPCKNKVFTFKDKGDKFILEIV
ncbi:DUF2920 family protein [Campylobacter subantarcticus]|uniref:DUF2920 domain protein n=1 Tax=Campylobacter subantarcticus LMG 24374 TaxID=1388751 RepID=A0A0A8H9D1_9BACT|nr:DUF2920 family protein [Campylobacter subantarcticus]AJC90696.1 hypothetical protein (DUF2920 domain) [Campylobacter subantarcticus LMG 24374]